MQGGNLQGGDLQGCVHMARRLASPLLGPKPQGGSYCSGQLQQVLSDMGGRTAGLRSYTCTRLPTARSQNTGQPHSSFVEAQYGAPVRR